MTVAWRLSVYDIGPGAAVRFSAPGCRFLYVTEGTGRIESPTGMRALAAGEGDAVGAGDAATADGMAWLCELAPPTALLDPGPAFAVLSKALSVAAAGPRLFRVDRIDLSAGARTPRHFHRGPGIRRLIFGQVRVEIGADVIGAGPGGAWFEPGDEPVLGANAAPGQSAFLRASLLPIDLIGGKSSFVPASESDAAGPRGVAQRLLHEATVEIA